MFEVQVCVYGQSVFETTVTSTSQALSSAFDHVVPGDTRFHGVHEDSRISTIDLCEWSVRTVSSSPLAFTNLFYALLSLHEIDGKLPQA